MLLRDRRNYERRVEVDERVPQRRELGVPPTHFEVLPKNMIFSKNALSKSCIRNVGYSLPLNVLGLLSYPCSDRVRYVPAPALRILSRMRNKNREFRVLVEDLLYAAVVPALLRLHAPATRPLCLVAVVVVVDVAHVAGSGYELRRLNAGRRA